MVPSALMQLNILNLALESNDMAVTVPWWSSMVLVFTIMAGLVYFEESSSMGSPPLFFLGALANGCLCLRRQTSLARGTCMCIRMATTLPSQQRRSRGHAPEQGTAGQVVHTSPPASRPLPKYEV